MTAAPAIEVLDLEKRYGDLRAVDRLSFAIAPGEVFGLLGPNGAGKTTTVEILEGYRRADGGRVEVLGHDPWLDGARLRPRIGVMLQDGGLYPGVRPLEVLRLFAAFYEEPEDPEHLLEVVGLRDARNMLVRRLSGGQQQRLSLALALVGRPDVVFLDEPTAGMDPRARTTTWSLVRALRDRGTTVLLTTHSMHEAEQLCDRVGIVHRGRLVAYGTPSELTSTAATDVRFSAAPGLDTEKLARVLELPAARVTEVRPGDYLIDDPATPARIAALAAWLDTQDVLLSELSAGQGTLEDVFLRLTSEDGE